MALFFDYSTVTEWKGAPTGVPRTVYCLARAFRELVPDCRLVVFNNETGEFVEADYNNTNTTRRATQILFSPGDVLLSTGASWAFASYNKQVSLLKARSVRFYQLFYDLIPTLFPYFYKDGVSFGDYFGKWTREALDLCSGSFAISKSSRNDVAAWCGISAADEGQLRVIRLGEDFTFSAATETLTDRFTSLPAFLLCVGTLEIRKNQTCLLNAYRILAQRYPQRLPKLLLAGRQGWIDGNIDFQIAHDRALAGLVHVVSDASDYELDSLYSRCLFTLFPAIYEGWGLPVAESLRHGKPCICSNTSSMPEIAPSLTRFASPYSTEEWVQQIQDMLFQPGLLEQETRRIQQSYIPTKWIQTAHDMLVFIKNSKT